MPSPINPTVGDFISFQLVKNGINGDDRVEVKVSVALMDYATARLIDNQVNIKHTNLYPYFKDAVNNINDPAAYQYIAVTNSNGVTEVIGIPWIQASTYRLIEGRTATLVITNWREDFKGPVNSFLANLGATFTLNVVDRTSS